jgi:hypothetical protein
VEPTVLGGIAAVVTPVVTVALTVLNVVLAVVSLVSALYAWRDRKRAAYVWFYDVIAKHHSPEMTSLRGDVLGHLEARLASARTQHATLAVVDPAFCTNLISLVNYYEGLGMFLEGAWKLFPRSTRRVMCAMLHNSVGTLWELIDRYADEVHPNRPADWAAGVRWLYKETRKTHSRVLTAAPALGGA